MGSSDQVTVHSPARRGWLLVALALPLYAFLYDNATSLPSTMGYGWTRLTPLTRQVRLAEIVFIGVALGLALTYGVSRTTRNLLAGSLLFIGLGLLSYLRSADVSLLDGARLIYQWVLPVFIFIIAREAPLGRGAWKWVSTTVFVWVLVSAVVSWIQFAWLGYPVGDDITGFNKDAHVNGTLLMLTALQLLAFALFLEKRSALFVALALLVTMVLSSVLKVMFLGVVAVALLVWIYWRSGARHRPAAVPRALTWGLALALTVALAATAFTRFDLISSDRLGDLWDKVRSDPASLGPLVAHRAALTKIAKDLPTLALGVGPFRFANPISVGQVLAEGRLGRMAAGEVLAIADETGEQTRITLSSSLLAEFGILAVVVVGFLYLGIARAVWRCRFDGRLDIRARSAGLLACGCILALVPMTSLFGSLEVMSLSWPVMLLSGLTCRESALDAATAEPRIGARW